MKTTKFIKKLKTILWTSITDPKVLHIEEEEETAKKVGDNIEQGEMTTNYALNQFFQKQKLYKH